MSDFFKLKAPYAINQYINMDHISMVWREGDKIRVEWQGIKNASDFRFESEKEAEKVLTCMVKPNRKGTKK
jgi:hypothetical protein